MDWTSFIFIMRPVPRRNPTTARGSDVRNRTMPSPRKMFFPLWFSGWLALSPLLPAFACCLSLCRKCLYLFICKYQVSCSTVQEKCELTGAENSAELCCHTRAFRAGSERQSFLFWTKKSFYVILQLKFYDGYIQFQDIWERRYPVVVFVLSYSGGKGGKAKQNVENKG